MMQWQLFGDLPSEEIRRVLATARRRTSGRGEVVFHEGDPADSLHLIAKGRFAVRVTTPLGETATLAIRGPGEAFGELALVSDAPRSATVAALESAETHSLYRREFDELRREHPYVNRMLVAVLAASVRRMDELIVEAFYVGAEKRVLRRLRDLATVYGNGSSTITVPLTQEDLAGLAGTSRATVNRVLREAPSGRTERPETPSRPDSCSRACSSSSSRRSPARRRCSGISGSIAPERVAIGTPSSGLYPIVVSTDRPSCTAVTEQPPPRWQTTRRGTLTCSDAHCTESPWKPYRRIPHSSCQRRGTA